MSGDFAVATAAVNWFDSNGGLHIRVYTTDGNFVTERKIDAGGPGWETGTFSQQGTMVSATAWYTSAGGPSIRVYCTLQGATTEWCSDNGGAWYQGSFAPS